MDKYFLPYGRQSIDPSDIRAVVRTLESPFLTTGPKVEAFEAELCRLTGAAHAVACANGTAALHLACMALGVGPGDVGLTSPNSFLASANCIEYCGGRADFIDIDPASLCLCPGALADYCRGNGPPKVVIPVDFAGTAADLSAIYRLAGEYGFHVIEDAAHALGSQYEFGGKTYACGSCAHSDLAVFSFHPVKNITTGEGGAVMTNDADLAQRMRSLRHHGMERPEAAKDQGEDWYYEMSDMGFNYRITDFQCALGHSQLARLDRFKARRREIVGLYNRAFRDRADLILPGGGTVAHACPHLYPLQFPGGPEVRKAAYHFLKQAGIFTQVHYIPIYFQPYYAGKYHYHKGKCPNAEAYYSQCLSLPLFPDMVDDQVQAVVNRVKAFLDGLGRGSA
ncbi:MAG: UDP-4-amino-4,6-dideoxy-N-acetyl-beta-L-altrosamine transaminase [Desulfobacter sp.]|nr:MAG: UDP-4-amino-4,6-dideoxy-N-acetyl-beta-L-altrosamine transaminase [Desulfobacter sp.]